MRIAIAGASGTGKTTLVKKLASELGLPINPVGSRAVAAEMGFMNPYDVDVAGKREEFQRLLFAKKLEWELSNERFISDRSFYDNLAYTALHTVYSIDEAALRRYREAMNRYTHVYLVSIKDVLRLDDVVRVASRSYHELYEALVEGLFSTGEGEFKFRRLCGELDDRYEQVLGSL